METEGQTWRPYGVWSLGCVFLEILVWAVMGFSALEDFKRERVCKRTSEVGYGDDGFWQKRDDGAVTLRDSVLKWIQKLQKKVQDQPHQPFQELLDVITLRMLEIDRTERISADTLSLDMQRILVSKGVVLRQGIDTIGNDNRGSEKSPVALVTQSSLTSPSRRPSIAPILLGPRVQPGQESRPHN